jgi:acetylglutamate kinase
VKIVLTIRGRDLRNALVAANCSRAIAELLHEGHFVVLVHDADVHHADDVDMSHEVTCSQRGLTSNELGDHNHKLIAVAADLNTKLAGLLGGAGVPAFGLCGTDANIVRLRRYSSNGSKNANGYEIAQIDASWLDLIVRNGGVPIMASVALGLDGHYHSLNADRMASICAVSWKADTLIFLTASDGVHNSDGSVMRWLDIEEMDKIIKSQINQDICSSLHACREALNNGICRVRFLPLDQIGNLAVFYFTKIEAGTEVISSSY